MPRTIWLAGLLALSLSACVETRSTHTNGNGGGANPPDSLDRVLSRTFTVPAFKLESGQVLPEMTLAYEHSLVSPRDLSRLDVAFFNVNGYIALIVLAAVVLGLR